MRDAIGGLSASALPPAEQERQTFAVVTRRVVPFLFVCFAFAFLDRVNIGFAKLQMQSDLKFSESTYGFGAGIFFIAYFLLEVPSNVALKRFGARRWLARIMVTWGVISAATAFVTTPTQFYLVRILLGAAEAGFFPGVMLYLTYWLPAKERGQAITWFLIAIPVSTLVGGPVSGWILQVFSDSQMLRPWQWLFLLEGMPSVLLGILCWFCLHDSIDEVKWLTAWQKEFVRSKLDRDEAQAGARHFKAAIRKPQIWLMSLVNFTLLSSIVVVLWLPSFYKNAGLTSAVEIGWMSAIPHGVAIVAMVLVAKNSDRTGERRWHTAVPALVAAAASIMMALSLGSPTLLLLSSSAMVASFLTLNALFWNLPTTFLTGNAAVVGIAFINAVGQIAGFVAPTAFGWLYERTGAPVAGLASLSALYLAGAVATLLISKQDVDRRDADSAGPELAA